MASNYDLIASQSSIQVLSPKVVQEVVVCTIQTKPSRAIFDYWIDRITWDAGDAPTILTAVAGDVEHVMTSQPVSGAFGGSELDKNGLLTELITFTVSYTPPGSLGVPVTVDVDVPVLDFGQGAIAGQNFGLNDAINRIATAYQQLVAAAGVPLNTQPGPGPQPTPGPVTQPGPTGILTPPQVA